ncbi:MAG: DinB family protein [Planctomycetes bacterium]|nr:DinB family protein [Planctomycetota bacterium]
MDVRAALKSQYHAALAMLRQAVEHCPDDLWNEGPNPAPFWQVAYHTLFFTHLYLQTNEACFRPWDQHREGHEDLPWPPDSGRAIPTPYTKDQVLDYWRFCSAAVDAAVDTLDLASSQSGFSWHKTMTKLEHQIQNIRHIQHHAAFLSARLRARTDVEVRWVRRNQESYCPEA